MGYPGHVFSEFSYRLGAFGIFISNHNLMAEKKNTFIFDNFLLPSFSSFSRGLGKKWQNKKQRIILPHPILLFEQNHQVLRSPNKNPQIEHRCFQIYYHFLQTEIKLN